MYEISMKGAVCLLGEKIKMLRLQQGLSQEELAKRLGVVRQTVSKWEKELSLPDSDVLIKIAEVFNITVSSLIGEETESVSLKSTAPHRLKAWEITVIAVGAPLWLPLLIAAAIIALSLYVSIGAIIISLWAVFASFVGCFLGGIVAGLILIFKGNAPSGVAMLAAGIVCAGLAIFMFYGCKGATMSVLMLTKKIAIWTRNCFVKKEEAQ